MVGERTLTVKLYSVPADRVLFRVLKNSTPIMGAVVERIQQTSVVAGIETPVLQPVVDSKTTDVNGEVMFLHRADMDADKFSVVAYIPNSSFGFIKGEWKLTHATSYELKLKEYIKPPRLYVEFTLRDVIGAEAYGSILAAVEKWRIEQQGFIDVQVFGKGTRVLRVEFTPPFTQASPLIVAFAATTKGIIALLLIVVALGIIFISLWKFGEKAAIAVGGAGLIVVLILALSALKERKK